MQPWRSYDLRSRETRRRDFQPTGWEVVGGFQLQNRMIFPQDLQLRKTLSWKFLWRYWKCIRIVCLYLCWDGRLDIPSVIKEDLLNMSASEESHWIHYIARSQNTMMRHPLVVSWTVKGREVLVDFCAMISDWRMTETHTSMLRICLSSHDLGSFPHPPLVEPEGIRGILYLLILARIPWSRPWVKARFQHILP